MLNVLVVDDEPRHRRGLTWMLKQLKPEYTVYDAKDGAEALQSISLHPVDLIFTDIQMPVMDGLELMERLSRRGGSESIVIMSAYSDFAYAQRALQLGACDYLLKPAEEQRIVPLLDKAESKARAIRLASAEASLAELLDGSPTPIDVRRLERCFPDFRQGAVIAAAFGPASECRGRQGLLSRLKARLESLAKTFGLSAACYTADKTLIALLASPQAAPPATPELKAALGGLIRHFALEDEAELTLGLGSPFTRWEEAARSYQQAVHALQTRFYKGEGMLFEAGRPADNGGPTSFKLDAGQMSAYILAGDKPAISACLESAFQEAVANGYPPPDKLKHSIAASIRYIVACLLEQGLAPLHSAAFEEALLQCHTAGQLHKAAKEWIFELADRSDQRKQCRHESMIDYCIAYIENHYPEDLSLSTLAAKFHFNPSYFCMLFKTHTRTTVNQYITQTRMRAAAALLLNTSHKVYQIAETVGYKDVKYFIRLFRKQYGASPEEYRQLAALRR